MKNVKIVIGANFGDEGKGLATDYFADKAMKENNSCIVVCSNGGAQKGHTIVTPQGLRHVTHHFGSGVLVGADTYLSEEFIINPILFRQEREQLIVKGITPKKVYVNNNCRFTTPFDMILNQIIEESRGKSKHGSCGLGINETILRNSIESRKFKLDMISNSAFLQTYLINIRDYYIRQRLNSIGITTIPEPYNSYIKSNLLIDNYIYDMNYFFNNSIIVHTDDLLYGFENVIFECSQGLLLDKDNNSYFPHLTPSNTGVKNPMMILDKLVTNNVDIEVCYVTRTYVTRHGVGRFDTECNKSKIGKLIVDLTNKPNPFQDTLRYGKLDVDLLYDYIYYDLFYMNCNYHESIMVTHMNETNGLIKSTIGDIDIDIFNNELESHGYIRFYTSDGETRDSVKISIERKHG